MRLRFVDLMNLIFILLCRSIGIQGREPYIDDFIHTGKCVVLACIQTFTDQCSANFMCIIYTLLPFKVKDTCMRKQKLQQFSFLQISQPVCMKFIMLP